MAPPRHVIIAGAGIAGLTAALALARAGVRVTVYEQAGKLEETGAGLQLSPNGSRVLIALGLRERLASVAVAPQAIRVMSGGSGARGRAHSAWRGSRTALRRALLVDPSRRSAIGAR